ncbi:centromere protein H [Cebus imitator]|uniref:centromere protein H n=1 Tax=Cebus imitator TaxID=2715852 RepID=UPI001899D9A0|nr:centromere protein H [Cebus imitator]
MEEQPQKQAADQPADSGGEGGAGGPSQVAGAQAARSEDRMTLLLRLRAQTKQQLLEYKSILDASEEKTPEQIMQEKQIEAYLFFSHRIRLSTALKKNLEKISTESSALMDNMKHLLKLNKLVMKLQQESWDLEEKLLDIRKKRLRMLQNLILGSKVNWAEDSALKEIVLQLEKNVDMI